MFSLLGWDDCYIKRFNKEENLADLTFQKDYGSLML